MFHVSVLRKFQSDATPVIDLEDIEIQDGATRKSKFQPHGNSTCSHLNPKNQAEIQLPKSTTYNYLNVMEQIEISTTYSL